MSLEEHRVLYCLDEPIRVLKWTVPEFSCMAIPVSVGLFLDELLLGLVLGFGFYLGYACLLKRLGLMSSWMYWTLPLIKLPHIPPSWIRVLGR